MLRSVIEELNMKYGEYGSLSEKYHDSIEKSNHDMLADSVDQLTYYNLRKSIFGLTIIKAPALLNATGACCCGLAKTIAGEYFIFTDEIFDMMSLTSKNAILQHEVGHYMNSHLDFLDVNSGYTRNFKHEIEADLWSANIVGKRAFINALEEFKKMVWLVTNQPSMAITCIQELDARIEALEKASTTF